MKHLYVAHIEVDIVVMAANESDAIDVAEEHLRDEVWVSIVKSIHDVEPDWLDSVPYGSDDDQTIREILGD